MVTRVNDELLGLAITVITYLHKKVSNFAVEKGIRIASEPKMIGFGHDRSVSGASVRGFERYNRMPNIVPGMSVSTSILPRMSNIEHRYVLLSILSNEAKTPPLLLSLLLLLLQLNTHLHVPRDCAGTRDEPSRDRSLRG